MLYDAIIIGGGVTGCTIARELMRYAIRVALIESEAEVGFGTSKANSGIIHGGHHSSPDTLKGKLEWEGNQMWDTICEELGFGFKRIGELTVALTEDQIPTLEKLQKQGESKGVPGLEIWQQERLRKEEPHLTSEAIAALYAPTTGVVNPYEACFALIENACINGLNLFTNCKVTAINQTPDHHWVIHTPRGEFNTRFVINAAGLYADAIAEFAGVRTFTIKPRKGEEYLLDKRLIGLVKRVIFPCPTPVSKGILVIPTYDGTLMVGPTAEMVDDKTDLTTSHEGGKKVFDAVTQTVPGISPRDCIAEFAGLRAVVDGEDFIIGTTAKPGFINVAGIQSPGLTAAPAIATMVRDILHEEGLSLAPKDSFIPSITKPIHFASLSTEAQIALVNQNPSYGRIICRCELISEGEILDAISRGAKTLDGIKFRTRAGMGRCQGGFCTGRCMQLLSQEYNIPMTEITKRGGDTWVVREQHS
ncbi:NAD(P)/FAD-dependent oxidoreductase [Limnospira sp. Paracas R14]|uniref:NAD(P)/FAD-dependent oxidoreductase n=1 Tax=Limnospira sp. Paracas R14 TaxID=2981108 RepID=UPI0028E18209|nr:NAD(P)/FAD-dependent oxidoreductase [Limnospira sp. Paracas R14]